MWNNLSCQYCTENVSDKTSRLFEFHNANHRDVIFSSIKTNWLKIRPTLRPHTKQNDVTIKLLVEPNIVVYLAELQKMFCLEVYRHISDC